MRKYIFWGVLLIVLGVFWLLKAVNIVHFCWRDVLSLWPLILIWIGIGLLPVKDGYKIALDLLAMAIGFFILAKPDICKVKKYETAEMKLMSASTATFTFANKDSIRNASLHLKAGAAEIKLVPKSLTQLVNIVGNAPDWVNLNVDYSDHKALIDVEIGKNVHNITFNDSKLSKEFIVELDPEPVWEMEFEKGATDVDLDLTLFKIKNFILKAGASDIDVKFGDLYDHVTAEIEIGAADLDIKLPKTMNCRIECEGAINDWDISDFVSEKKGVYFAPAIIPPGSSTTVGTIYIKITSGVSSISIERY